MRPVVIHDGMSGHGGNTGFDDCISTTECDGPFSFVGKGGLCFEVIIVSCSSCSLEVSVVIGVVKRPGSSGAAQSQFTNIRSDSCNGVVIDRDICC